MGSVFPKIGSWYQELATSDLFEVIAIDENAKSIEVQYESGDIDEIEFEQWSYSKYTQVDNIDYLRVQEEEPEDNSGIEDAFVPENWSYNTCNSDLDGLGDLETGAFD